MQPETEIAVLQVQVKNIEDKIGEVKQDLKAIHECLDANAEETRQMLKSMREQDVKEHTELAGKISVLEKWRWMLWTLWQSTHSAAPLWPAASCFAWTLVRYKAS